MPTIEYEGEIVLRDGTTVYVRLILRADEQQVIGLLPPSNLTFNGEVIVRETGLAGGLP